MATEIRIPPLGESITEAVLIRWLKADGQAVTRDEPIAELETDKANVNLGAPGDGALRTGAAAGSTVQVGQVVGSIGDAASAAAAPQASAAAPAVAAPAKPASPAPTPPAQSSAPAAAAPTPVEDPALGPAVRRLLREHNLEPAGLVGTGPGGRILPEDVHRAVAAKAAPSAVKPAPQAPPPPAPPPPPAAPADGSRVRRAPMTKIRKRIAERLVAAQHNAAMLTTFNEVDMSAVLALREKWKDRFEKTHGVGLGFLSFFARAVSAAMRDLPIINAQIDGSDIVHNDDLHLSIAVSTERGLLVPVLRRVQEMSFAKIESEIKRVATAARDGKLTVDELSGGTFTITNGGVFGSLLSTPILNPPQSAILGLHKIEKRPVVVDDQIVIRPMMYLALSYDHRLVDGKEAVTFLVRIKECIEDPSRLLLQV